MTTLDVAPTERPTLLAADALAGSDFEDDLQIASAVQMGADAIVTRDPKGFAANPIAILTPADLVALLPVSPTP